MADELKAMEKERAELQGRDGPVAPVPYHHLRFEKVPAGFIRYRGKRCPYADDMRVELVIRTGDGLGFAGPCRADAHDWSVPKSELGSIAGYRLAAGQPH